MGILLPAAVPALCVLLRSASWSLRRPRRAPTTTESLSPARPHDDERQRVTHLLIESHAALIKWLRSGTAPPRCLDNRTLDWDIERWFDRCVRLAGETWRKTVAMT